MKPTAHLAQIFCFSGSGGLLTNHRPGLFSNEIRRVAMLAIVLGMIAVLATGCQSTAGEFNTSLTSRITNDHSRADSVT